MKIPKFKSSMKKKTTNSFLLKVKEFLFPMAVMPRVSDV